MGWVRGSEAQLSQQSPPVVFQHATAPPPSISLCFSVKDFDFNEESDKEYIKRCHVISGPQAKWLRVVTHACVSRATAELMAVPGSFVSCTCSRYQLTQTSSELPRAGNTAQCRAIPWRTSGPTFHLRPHKAPQNKTLPYYLVERTSSTMALG